MRSTKRPVYIFHSLLFTQCALQTSGLAITFHAIYPTQPPKRPVYLLHSPLFTQRAPPNVTFSYYIPRYFPNANIQTSRLAIPFPAMNPMFHSNHPVYLFHSSLFTQCGSPNVLFSYSVTRHLPNAPVRTSRLSIPFPAI